MHNHVKAKWDLNFLAIELKKKRQFLCFNFLCAFVQDLLIFVCQFLEHCLRQHLENTNEILNESIEISRLL